MSNSSPRWIASLIVIVLLMMADGFAYDFRTALGVFRYFARLSLPLPDVCRDCLPAFRFVPVDSAPVARPTKFIASAAPFSRAEHLKARARVYALKHGLEPAWFAAILETESLWDPKSFNASGCRGRGLGQLTVPAVRDCRVLGGQKISPADPESHFDVELNLDCAAWTLARHYRRFKDRAKATLAYQSGAENVRQGKISARARTYLQQVLLRLQAEGASKL